MTAARPDPFEPWRLLGEGLSGWLGTLPGAAAARGDGAGSPGGADDGTAPAADGASRSADASADADADADAGSVPGGGHGDACRGCPVCAALAVLRGERPDVTDALADVLGSAAAALRGLSRRPDTPTDPPAGAAAARAGSAPAEPPAPDVAGNGGPAPAVQRIEVA